MPRSLKIWVSKSESLGDNEVHLFHHHGLMEWKHHNCSRSVEGLRFFIKQVGRNIGVNIHGRKKRDRSDGGGFILFIININGRWGRMGRRGRCRKSHASFTIALVGICIGTTRIWAKVVEQVPSLSYGSKAMRATVWHRKHGRASKKGDKREKALKAWSPKGESLFFLPPLVEKTVKNGTPPSRWFSLW